MFYILDYGIRLLQKFEYFIKSRFINTCYLTIKESCTDSFWCFGDKKCIPLRLMCDQFPDCTDNSDESCGGFFDIKIPTSADFNDEYLSLAGWKREQIFYVN
jgi:hypothetical protein